MKRSVILVVDDEAEQREIFRTSLERHGYAVLEAIDGVAGLEAMEKHGAEVDLVITDMVMPRIGGRELLWRVNERFPRTPVLMTSGLLDPDTASDEGRLSPAGFLPKPVSPGALILKVREILGVADPGPPAAGGSGHDPCY